VPASCLRTTRPATPAELAVLRAQLRPDSTMGCLVAVALPFLGVCFFVGEGFGQGWGGAAGTVLGMALVAAFARSWRRFIGPTRARIRQDLADAMVEVLTLDSVTPLEVPSNHSSVDPTFVIELDSQRVLILLGPWLVEPTTFGGQWQEPHESDAGDAYANGLPPPYAFPTSAFRLERFPSSGEVVRIEITGDYVAPKRIDVDVNAALINDAPTRIIEGTAADLPAAVQRLAVR